MFTIFPRKSLLASVRHISCFSCPVFIYFFINYLLRAYEEGVELHLLTLRGLNLKRPDNSSLTLRCIAKFCSSGRSVTVYKSEDIICLTSHRTSIHALDKLIHPSIWGTALQRAATLPANLSAAEAGGRGSWKRREGRVTVGGELPVPS